MKRHLLSNILFNLYQGKEILLLYGKSNINSMDLGEITKKEVVRCVCVCVYI